MSNDKKEPEFQSVKLIGLNTQQGKDIVFTLTAEGHASDETTLMLRSIRTLLEALNEDNKNNFMERQKMAKELLLDIADFIVGDNSSDTNGFYKSLLKQKVLLNDIVSTL